MLSKSLASELYSLEKVNEFLRNTTKTVGSQPQIILAKKKSVEIGVLGGKSFVSHLDNGSSHKFKIKDLIKHVAKLSDVNSNNFEDVKTNLAEVYIKIHAIDLEGDKKLKEQKGFKRLAIFVRRICSKIFHIPHAREQIPHSFDAINNHVSTLLKSLEIEKKTETRPSAFKRKGKGYQRASSSELEKQISKPKGQVK